MIGFNHVYFSGTAARHTQGHTRRAMTARRNRASMAANTQGHTSDSRHPRGAARHFSGAVQAGKPGMAPSTHAHPTRTHGRPTPRRDAQEAYYIPASSYDGASEKGSRRAAERGGSKLPLVVALVVMVLIAAGGAYVWLTRPVSLTLDGQQVEARPGTTLSALMADNGVSVKAGNFVSVGGTVLEEGGGRPLNATVNGAELTDEQAGAYRVAKGDEVTVTDGDDVIEQYTAETATQQPALTMDGVEGPLAYVAQWGQVGEVETRTGSVSGETAQVTTKEKKDCVIKLHYPKPDGGEKLVALTFDDGPSQYTQAYLDILKRYDAKATFFELGQNVQGLPNVAKAVVDDGHQVACHSHTHPLLTKLDAAGVQGELSQGFEAIKNATGVETTVLRPPYGEFKESTWLRSNGLLSLSVHWTQDSEDWRRPGVDAIVSKATAGVVPGSIILMHDGGGPREQDLEALPKIIEALQARGYKFVTLNELMQSDGSIPQDIKSGNARPPADTVWPTELGDA